MKVGTLCYEGSALVRTVSRPRSITGGSVVEVERVEDSTAPNMVLSDGTLHPVARAGYRWTACLVNLKERCDWCGPASSVPGI